MTQPSDPRFHSMTPSSPRPELNRHSGGKPAGAAVLTLLFLVCIPLRPLGALTPAETEPGNGSASTDTAEQDLGEGYIEISDSAGVTVQGVSPAGPLETNPGLTLSRDEIAQTGSANAVEFLEREAGVSFLKTGSYGTVSTVSLGGFTGSRVAVMIDGVPVNSPQDGAFDLADIDLGSIERLEVRRLAAAGTGSNSGLPGGSISIDTAGPVATGFCLRGEFSNQAYLSARFPESVFTSPVDTQTLKFQGEAGFEATGIKLGGFAVRALNRYGWIDSVGTERVREGNRVSDGGLNGSVFRKLSPFTALSGSFFFRSGDKEIPGSIDYPSAGRQKDSRALESLRLETKRLGRDDLEGAFTAGHTRSRLLWTEGASESEHVSDNASLGASLTWYPAASLSVTTNMQGELSAIDSDQNGRRSAFGGGISGALFWAPAKTILVNPSLSAATDGERLEPVPRFGWALESGGGYRFTNNVYRSFRFPSFNDRFWSGDPRAQGNPNLKSEEGFGADIGIQRAQGNYAFSQTARVSWYRNAILWSSENGVWMPSNVGEAWYVSASTAANRSLGADTSVNLGYEWLFTRVLTGDLEFADGKYMPYQPVHTLRVGVTQKLGRFTMKASGLYASERYTGVLNLAALPPYFLLDLSITAPILPWMDFSFEARNAFGASYQLTEGYPMPGTGITAGIRFELP